MAEFRKSRQHIEEALPGRGRRVDRLLGCLERNSALLEIVNDILKVPNRPRQTIDPSDDQRIALPEELEQCGQLLPAIGACAAHLLRSDDGATGSGQGVELDRQALVMTGNAGVP
jgi:hypothetical protein